MFTFSITGKVVFQDPLHRPRVYEGAPPGIHVTTVHAYDSGRKAVTYNLLDVREYTFFSVDSLTGNISTAKTINKRIGDTYEIIVVAISQGETKLRQLQIAVSEYNIHPPVFEHDVYRGEMHIRSKVGSTVLKVKAKDEDMVSYNAKVLYKLDFPYDSRGRFTIDPATGVLSLVRALDIETSEPVIDLGVTAVDGGSPVRTDYAKIEILVKTISEPRDVRSANATGSTVQVCWSRPEFGQVLGYIIKYREQKSPHGTPAFLNITSGATSKCSTLVELKPWTDYEFRIYGWNRYETGQGSSVGSFGTRPDYCQMNICQHGECHILNEEPGYHCDCKEGYYGEVCEKLNPCILEPCENFGKCFNITNNKHRCECLPGFSGQNCSDFNPCAIRPSPCLNGGRCESTASHKYQCYCMEGYYGKTCQFYNPCSEEPCKNAGKCHNESQEEYICKCASGFTGRNCEVDIDDCESSPCKHGGTCKDEINDFYCHCAPGYKGKRCNLVEHCPSDTLYSSKGVFRWNSTSHGSAQLIECPFGSSYPDQESSTGYAKRKCYLLSNGSVVWGQTNLSSCREEVYKTAEELTAELFILTEDPRHLNIERLQVATKQIEGVFEYALHDKRIAYNVLSIVSNLLAISDSLLWTGDVNGTVTRRITDLVDKYASDVSLERGEELQIETENLVVKVVSWDREINGVGSDDLTFMVHYQTRQQKESRSKGGNRSLLIPPSFLDDIRDDGMISFNNDAELSLPVEAIHLLQNQTYQDVRIKFVAYKNDKFFREKPSKRWQQCYDSSKFSSQRKCLYIGATGYQGRQVLQASLMNFVINNLSTPVVYILPSPTNVKVFCAYWDEDEHKWATDGLITNQSDNSTTCLSFHLTSFSLLLDPSRFDAANRYAFLLSIIIYIGCGLSMLGLLLTIITYSIFRCLNRENPGKILIQLCISMLMLNVVFVLGSQRGWNIFSIDICAVVALLIHYFLLSTLTWICVEAINMHQLLVHIFISSGSCFMLKRTVLAWGIPLIIVGVTVVMHWEVYNYQNEYCILSPTNPYIYYISFLGPICFMICINLIIFLMITRVLFSSQNITVKKPTQCGKSDKFLVTTVQIKGAFIVMVLLVVSWIFGAFVDGDTKLYFQYVFCVANSLQGLIIFLVRCLHYSEARGAWYQLIKTGTFKKYRGVIPPDTWSGNTCSTSPNKINGSSTATRVDSADITNQGAFWSGEGPITSGPTTVARDTSCISGYSNPTLTMPSDRASDYATIHRGSVHLLNFSNSGITLEPIDVGGDETIRNLSRSNSGFVKDNENTASNYSGAETLRSNYYFDKNPERNNHQGDINPDKTAVQRKDRKMSFLAREKAPENSDDFCRDMNEEKNATDRLTATTLDRKIYASRASSLFGNFRSDSQPDLGKQNSWPRTLSSFSGERDFMEITSQAKSDFPNPTENDVITKDNHSYKLLPLNVQQTHPSFLHSYFTLRRGSNFSQMSPRLHSPFNETNSLPGRAASHLAHPNFDASNRILANIYPDSMPQHSSKGWENVPLENDYGFEVVGNEVSISGPTTRVYVSQTPLVKQHVATQSDLLEDIDSFKIYESQNGESPSQSLFEETVASKL
nr:uncharacterized protein LOC107457219 [Parasteatoda tepidariorum]